MVQCEYVEVVPEASRIMEGLRDTGYNFNTAIADIVDNSIAANATVVRIKVDQLFDSSIRVSVVDNGSGMTREELISAMRYGAPKRQDAHSLGKFGLGLKTASTSCCRRLVVGSVKPAGDKGCCAVWDLDAVAADVAQGGGGWQLQIRDFKDAERRELSSCIGGGTGTIVVWENCDRLLSARYSNPSTAAFRNAFERAKKALSFHLSMTFQRFLDHDDSRARDVEIFLNGDSLAAWDPFCKELHDSYASDEFLVDCNGVSGRVKVDAYIVPQKDEFATDAEKQRIMPSYKNKALHGFSEESLSGFYIYRENRLIHWGDWFNMPNVDFHSKLCRFELSFDADLDEVFQVDIKKSRILLNDDIREALMSFAAPCKREGVKQYRTKQTKASAKRSSDIHAETNTIIVSAESSLVNPNSVVAVSPTEAQVTNRFGITITPYNVHDGVGDEGIVVETVDSLEDGHAWAPALIGGKRGVQLNANHEFYKRFYAANKENRAATQAMDYVFYAIAQAENEALDEGARENLEEARYEASKILRKLAKFLPDVSIEDIEGE